MFLLLPRRPEIGASQLPRPHLAFSRQTLQLPLALKPRGSSRMDNFFSCGVALAGLIWSFVSVTVWQLRAARSADPARPGAS